MTVATVVTILIEAPTERSEIASLDIAFRTVECAASLLISCYCLLLPPYNTTSSIFLPALTSMMQVALWTICRRLKPSRMRCFLFLWSWGGLVAALSSLLFYMFWLLAVIWMETLQDSFGVRVVLLWHLLLSVASIFLNCRARSRILPAPASLTQRSDQREAAVLTTPEDLTEGVLTFDAYLCQHALSTENASRQTCSICLEAYANRDVIKLLHCNHFFHRHCVDEWFLHSRETRCPMRCAVKHLVVLAC